MTFIFAGNFSQYRQWMNRNGLLRKNYPDLADACLVHDCEPGTKVICFGTYKERPDYEEIMAVLRDRNCDIREPKEKDK